MEEDIPTSIYRAVIYYPTVILKGRLDKRVTWSQLDFIFISLKFQELISRPFLKRQVLPCKLRRRGAEVTSQTELSLDTAGFYPSVGTLQCASS